MNKRIEIYTDGSSLGNPGPGGWGSVCIFEDGTTFEQGGFEKETTNNRMELAAVIESVTYATKHFPNASVSIHSDSAYVLGGITTWIFNWEKNGWKTANKQPVLNQDLWQILIAHVRAYTGTISWQKVKGHAGVVHNERADVIATGYAALQENFTL